MFATSVTDVNAFTSALRLLQTRDQQSLFKVLAK